MWYDQGNIPALTRLVQAYIEHDPAFVCSENYLVRILGCFQALVRLSLSFPSPLSSFSPALLSLFLSHYSLFSPLVFNPYASRLLVRKMTSLASIYSSL